ncbi:MAG: serine/threonine protein kinase [Gemmatimonadota bacterium]|nr:serine/threonine protein kinase [Gemmatimonadota bacterium]
MSERVEPLEKYAKRNTPLPREEVASIIEQIANAVDAAHRVGSVHRDLMPQNVMYALETKTITLLDFGIGAEADLSPEERLTRAGFFVGSLMYVAPEALSGQSVTAAADQYSLATMAYYLLTGCRPYLGKSQAELYIQLLSQPPVALNAARKGLTFGPVVEQVTMRGLSRVPAERYPSAIIFATELKKALLYREGAM